MKKAKLGLIILAASTMGLAACGNSSNPGSSSSESSSSEPDSSSSSESSSESSSTESSTGGESSSSSEAPKKINVAYYDDTFVFAGASDAGTGRVTYWAGDGGTVSAHTKSGDTYSLTYANAGQWYGIQIFYNLPYGTAGEKYGFKTTINSPAAGSITVNNVVTALVAGDNEVSIDPYTLLSPSLSIQLSTNGGTNLASGTLTMTEPEFIDENGYTYYETKFVSEGVTLKDIQVLSGKTVTAPADPTAPEGKVFAGWYNGDTQYTAGSVISAATTYTAKFADESSFLTVTLMGGSDILGTIKVAPGGKIVLPDSIDYPFGYAADGWYKEAALTTAWNFDSDTVSAAMSLYAKLIVTPTSTFMNDSGAGFVIPSGNQSHGDDGSLVISGFKGWAQGAWVVQVNFYMDPNATSKTYTFSFKYKVNATGADLNVYDESSSVGITSLALDTATEWTTKSVTFSSAISEKFKLSFELGAIAANIDVEFALSDIALTVA